MDLDGTMSFDRCVRQCETAYHPYQDTEHFRDPEKFPRAPF